MMLLVGLWGFVIVDGFLGALAFNLEVYFYGV